MTTALTNTWMSWDALQNSMPHYDMKAMQTAAKKVVRVVPRLACTDTAFVYTSSKNTNVQDAWKKFGWITPDPQKQAAVRALLNPDV